MIGYIVTGAAILLILFLGAASLRGIARLEEPEKAVDALWWHQPDEIYTDPCEVCHRWSECHGVDQENCPLWKRGENYERKI